MAFGTDQTNISYNPVTRVFGKIFGIPEFHSHLRWNAVRRYINWSASTTLEIGAGSGLMTFEVAKRLREGRIVASEFDESQVEIANKIISRTGLKNVSFSQLDVHGLRQAEQGKTYDQVLAIDVIEHIDDDQQLLHDLGKLVSIGGQLVVSVPTPNYPKIFGQALHESVGHKRDGYWLEDISQKLQIAGFAVTSSHYYTKRGDAQGCRLWYTRGWSIYRQMFMYPLLRVYACLLNLGATDSTAVSLALRAKKVS